MTAPLYSIPGSAAAPRSEPAPPAPAEPVPQARTVGEVLAHSQVEDVLGELERDLIGLAPVKQRVRVIAAGKVPSLGDLCARQTTAYLGSDEGVDGLQPAAIRYGVDGKTSVICLVTSDDGSRFSGSRRGAGR